MQTHFHGLALKSIALVAAMTVLPVTVAHADLGFWSNALVGSWRNPKNGDTYRFNSNATYTFTAGKTNAKSGAVAHSGFWKIAQPTEKESGGSMEGPVALVLKARTQTVRRNGHKVVQSSRRSFRLVVDVAFKNGDEHEIDPNHYYIGSQKWTRTHDSTISTKTATVRTRG